MGNFPYLNHILKDSLTSLPETCYIEICYRLATYFLPITTCYIQTFYNKKRFEVLVARLD